MPDTEVAMAETETTVTTQEPLALERSSVKLAAVQTLAAASERLVELQNFVQNYLTQSSDGGNDGGDYGSIPGTSKKTLLKSGADKLCDVYGMYDEYAMVSTVENWDTGLFDYVMTCTLRSRKDDSIVGTGMGSCSSFESKYRWRDQQRTCPRCGMATIFKSKDQHGGWYCWARKNGCGATFASDDQTITSQVTGRVENPDLADFKNTVLKMAKKRAKIDAVISVTRSSGIFTQDLEDLTPTSYAPPAIDAHFKPVDAPAAPAAEPPVPPAGSDSESGVLVSNMPEPRKGTTNGKPWTVYPVYFSSRVRASNGEWTNTASTLDEKVAKALENARVAQTLIAPVLVPGKRAGSFNITSINYPVS
jgi:hypothetical protein